MSNVCTVGSTKRRSSTSTKSKPCYVQCVSNDTSLSSCESNSFRTNFLDSDLLETNIKEIEYTLLGLMDNEAANTRSSQRLASISSMRNKLYSGENSGRRGRIASINKNRKTSISSNMSPESIQGILSNSSSHNISYDSYNQQVPYHQSSRYFSKENVDPNNRNSLNDSLFLDTPPYFSSPESKSNQTSNYCDLNTLVNNNNNNNNHLPTHSLLNNSYSAMSINSVDHSSPRVYQNYDSLLNSPKLSPSPTPYRKKNGEILMVKTACYYENTFNNNDHSYKNFNYNYRSQDGLNQNFCSPQYTKSDISFQSPKPSNSIDHFNKSSNHNLNSSGQQQQQQQQSSSKKSVKMSVPSNKRQILEEEFRKEKYPCNEKLQKLSNRLNMKYEEVQRYFKKRRTEEKETNNKFSNLVKLLNNYLEAEE